GTLVALTMLYEWRTGHVLFLKAADYQWSGNAGIFRAGGVLGGAPSASIVLAMLIVACWPLRAWKPRLVAGCSAIMAAAEVITYSRAGWIGLAVGVVVYLTMVPHMRRNLRLAYW